jgi:hypothetical protein
MLSEKGGRANVLEAKGLTKCYASLPACARVELLNLTGK